jgi:hypothetical protein
MLATRKQLAVRLTRFQPKVDKEGLKRVTVGLRLTETKGAVQGELSRAVEMLKENSTLDGTSCDETMEGVRLEFSSPVRPDSVTKVFEATNLFKFDIGRERSQEAGSIEKETSGRIAVDFKFTATLVESWQWGGENFGDDLVMTIEKAQGELLPDPEENPDSQEARNLRIINEEAEQAEKVTKKKGRGKKSKKADEAPASEE